MRLKSIELEAFRAFGEPSRLDFDADVVILSGRNGFGKTTVFDSLCWGLFEQSPRFRGTRDFTRAQANYLRNAFRLHKRPRVRIELTSDRDLVIERHGNDFSFAFGDDVSIGADAQVRLLEALGFSYLEPDEQLADSLRRALDSFSRSFLLHQDMLSKFVTSDSPRDRFDAFAELFFITPIRDFYTHLLEERSEAKERRVAASSQREIASAQLMQTKEELALEEERLARIMDQARQSDRDFSTEMAMIKEAVHRLLPNSQGIIEGDLDSLDEIVLELRQSSAEAESRLSQIRSLEESLPMLDDLVKEALELAGNLDRLQGELDALDAAVKRTEDEVDVVNAAMSEVGKELASTEASAQGLQSFLSDALEHVVGDVCPVCEQPIGREQLVAHLRSKLAEADPRVRQLTEQRASIQSHLAEVERRLSGLRVDETTLSRQRQLKSGRHQEVMRSADDIRELDSDLLDADLHNSDRRILIERQIGNLGDRFKETRDVSDRLNRLRPEFELIDARDRLARLQTSVRQPAALEEANRRATSRYGAAENTLEEIVAASRRAERAILEGLINSFIEPIQEAYSLLAPHPLFPELSFEFEKRGEAGELYFEVKSGDYSLNPATAFSAAQANALALSVFLSLNMAQDWSPLKVVLIDDPVQNLDDVNVLSMIDFLRTTIGSRQLVVSTALPNLVDLMIDKLRPAREGGRMIVHRFNAITQAGPSIETETFEYSPPLRVLDEIVRRSA